MCGLAYNGQFVGWFGRCRMCAWDDAEFIMCCATNSGSDDDGVVDCYGYTVLQCVNVPAEGGGEGEQHDLIQVRNPWRNLGLKFGEGGLQWGHGGPGWAEHPEVKVALNPDAEIRSVSFYRTIVAPGTVLLLSAMIRTDVICSL